MDKVLQKDAAIHCEGCPRPSCKNGTALPLLRKALLPKGRILLQKSAWIEKGDRDFHVAHGYVLEDAEARKNGPANWITAPFRLEDPNETEDGILLDSLPGLPAGELLHAGSLKETMKTLDLDRDLFCQLLLACFDALASHRQVLIAWDLERPEELEQRLSVLYWIYTCLPYDLWIRLGFDSVFTEKSAQGQVHLAFLDRESVQTGGQAPSVLLGNQTIPLGGNFLVLDGQIIHDNRYKTDWYGGTGLYIRWLERIVKRVWDSPEEQREAVLSALDAVRQSLQLRLDSVPEEERLDAETYDKACESCSAYALRELTDACEQPPVAAEAEKRETPQPPPPSSAPVPDPVPLPAPALSPVPPPAPSPIPSPSPVSSPSSGISPSPVSSVSPAPATPSPDFVDSIKKKIANQTELDKYQSIYQHRMQQPSLEDINVLGYICIREEELKPFAIGLLSAFAVRETDQTGKPGEVLNRYRELLPGSVYALLPGILFFEVNPEVNPEVVAVWKYCGLESGAEATLKRRFWWHKEMVAAYSPKEDLTGYILSTVGALPGLSQPNREMMEWELWGVCKCLGVNTADT